MTTTENNPAAAIPATAADERQNPAPRERPCQASCPYDGNAVLPDTAGKGWYYRHCAACGNRWTLDGTPVGGIGERLTVSHFVELAYEISQRTGGNSLFEMTDEESGPAFADGPSTFKAGEVVD